MYSGTSSYPPKNLCSGFTLLELMITISIMAIIAGIAVPSFKGMMDNSRIRLITQTFYGTLVLARSEAVKNNQQTILCISSDQATCTGTTWDEGWIIFVDRDASSSLTNGDHIFKSQEGLTESTLRSTDANLTQVIYYPDGTQQASADFNACIDNDPQNGSLISVGLTGRPSMESGASACP